MSDPWGAGRGFPLPGTQPVPPELRVAKLHGALGGSTWADPDDRAGEILARYPDLARDVRATRRFHASTVVRAVRDGAKGAVFAPSGFPCDPDPHVLALAEAPHARFAYTSIDPRVTLANRGSLAGPGVAACPGSVRDPQGLLALPEVAAIGMPVQVHAQLAAHYWEDALGARLMAEYARLLAPGSGLVLSAVLPRPGAAGEEFRQALELASGAPVYARTAAAMAAWAREAGLEAARPVTVRGLRLAARARPWRVAAMVARVR